MLDVRRMRKRTSVAGCYTLGLFNSGNGQPVREHLLRQAVRSCDSYATDILIFLEYAVKEMYKKDVSEIDIFFEDSGVRWKYGNGRAVGGEVPPLHYRYCMKLVKKDGCFTLYEAAGNV